MLVDLPKWVYGWIYSNMLSQIKIVLETQQGYGGKRNKIIFKAYGIPFRFNISGNLYADI